MQRFDKKLMRWARQHYTTIIVFIGLFCLLFAMTKAAFAADGQDLLAPADGVVEATFGQNSKLIIWIYTVEIAFSLWLFLKSRNPLVFGGLVAMLVVTKAFFMLIK